MGTPFDRGADLADKDPTPPPKATYPIELNEQTSIAYIMTIVLCILINQWLMIDSWYFRVNYLLPEQGQ